MFILPHTTDLNLARRPWVTWSIVAISILVFLAQSSSHQRVIYDARMYCDEMYSEPAYVEIALWKTSIECAHELASLHSMPDPTYFMTRTDGFGKYLPDWESDEIDNYFLSLQKTYASFALTSPLDLDAKLMYDPTAPNPWRMLTSALSHANFSHILFNLIFFIAFAPILELIAGRIRFIVILLLITVADSLAYTIAVGFGSEPLPTLGLSGVVYGMIGLGAYLVPRVRIRTLVWFFIYVRNHSVPIWVFAIAYVGMDFLSMLLNDDYGGTNLVAHVSGAVAGYLSGKFLLEEQKEDYAELIDEEIELQRERRANIMGNQGSANAISYRSITEGKQMVHAEQEYEELMEQVYTAVKTDHDSTAVLLLLREYDLWVEDLETYEEVFRRMKPWGLSRARLCIGRLLIHRYASNGKTARAQAIAEECLELAPQFLLADKADLGNMFQNATDSHSMYLAKKLMNNLA